MEIEMPTTTPSVSFKLSVSNKKAGETALRGRRALTPELYVKRGDTSDQQHRKEAAGKAQAWGTEPAWPCLTCSCCRSTTARSGCDIPSSPATPCRRASSSRACGSCPAAATAAAAVAEAWGSCSSSCSTAACGCCGAVMLLCWCCGCCGGAWEVLGSSQGWRGALVHTCA